MLTVNLFLLKKNCYYDVLEFSGKKLMALINPLPQKYFSLA